MGGEETKPLRKIKIKGTETEEKSKCEGKIIKGLKRQKLPGKKGEPVLGKK